jgi:uncharacterized membrane protein
LLLWYPTPYPRLCALLTSKAVLCPWEWTQRDSPAVIVLSVFFLLGILTTLGWATYKILTLPRLALYADPEQLNRWGYLYVSFRPERFFYIVPLLLYLLVKAFTLAFAQSAGVAQSIIILILELINLGMQAWLKPWLDRRTNIVNIAICCVNVINSVFLLVFSGVTNAPAMVSGIMGVIFFIVNAVFALTLLILLLVAVGFALCSKNPEMRYKPAFDAADEKNKPRDLDADLPPTSPGEEFAGAGRDGIPNTSLHDQGNRSLNSRDESERAVAMERAMGTSRMMWQQQQPGRLGDGRAGSLAGSLSSRPSFIGDGAPSIRSRPSFAEGSMSGAQGSLAAGQGSMRSYTPSMRSRPSVASSRSRVGTAGSGAVGGVVGGVGSGGVADAALAREMEAARQMQGQQQMQWNVGAGYDGVGAAR